MEKRLGALRELQFPFCRSSLDALNTARQVRLLRYCIDTGAVSQQHGQPKAAEPAPASTFCRLMTKQCFLCPAARGVAVELDGYAILIWLAIFWSSMLCLVWRLTDIFYGV